MAVLTAMIVVLTGCTEGPPPVVSDGTGGQSSMVAAPQPQEIVLAVDRLEGGFNPHTIADLTPVNMAVAPLIFPSAFRQGDDGELRIDHNLLESAEITSTDPFTVTYQIRRDASWSDTAPIAAEDFVYLADQMRSQPGASGTAGYQLIDQVQAGDGGKTVVVTFRNPYPGWRTLFRNLLPAHLLKDAPGGWTDAFDSAVPVSGGPFVLTGLDQERGQLLLERNDRYWGVPASVDRLLLREGADGIAVDTIRSGGAHGALFGRPDAITERLLDDLEVPVDAVVPQRLVPTVLLRPASEQLADDQVRAGVAAAIDRQALIATGAASGPSADRVANSQVLAPSRDGYRPTIRADRPPAVRDAQAVHRLLTAAGFEPGVQGWHRSGQPLELVVAAPADREPYRTLGARVVDQLKSAGFAATLRTEPADELFGTLLVELPPSAQPPADEQAGTTGSSGIDIALLPQQMGGDPATDLASLHGCPLVVPAGAVSAPLNPAGFCDPQLQPRIVEALIGALPAEQAIPATDAALWRRAVAIPLYEGVYRLVASDAVTGPRPSEGTEGPLAGANRWTISDR